MDDDSTTIVILMHVSSSAVNSLIIGPNDTRVGAVLYSRSVTVSLPLQTNVNTFKREVLSFQYPDETTATDLGIKEAVRMLSQSPRVNVSRTMMIITDGESDDRIKTRLEADAAKRGGINIWSIGVGKFSSVDELNLLATNGRIQTFLIEDYQQLSQELENLTTKACIQQSVSMCHRLDLVYVIDGSNSLGESNFRSVLSTVAATVDSFVVGPNDTRVGAVVYSRGVTEFVNLQTDADVFRQSVLRFQYPDESTATDLAINKAVNILTSDLRGSVRVPLVMIIITDGESDDRAKTRQEANSARTYGINISAIGVGVDANMTELAALTNNGFDQTYHLNNVQELTQQLQNLTALSCKDIVSFCYKVLDIVFVIDGSNSIGESVFVSALDTVSRAVDGLLFGEAYTRVGAVVYSQDVTDYLDLQTNATAFKTGVLRFSYPDETTYTNKGIKKAVELLDKSPRAGVPRAIVVITDGQSTSVVETVNQANVAKSKGISIWSIGVGQAADTVELANIATGGYQQVFKTASYQALSVQLQSLTTQVCDRTYV
ncbi:hypothetical protein Btru_029821 [Bulinus truncatus]|nr:hypothetical protein Btru_029821 [Bulinus truncatus]